MTPELSRRLAKISNKLHDTLGLDEYDNLISDAEKVQTFAKLSNWHKFLILKAEKDVSR